MDHRPDVQSQMQVAVVSAQRALPHLQRSSNAHRTGSPFFKKLLSSHIGAPL